MNIHLTPTDKPSRLVFEQRAFIRLLMLKGENMGLTKDSLGQLIHEPQHIYITNDEEIKEGDWCYDTSRNIISKCIEIITKSIKQDDFLVLEGNMGNPRDTYKKIILTTDQDLIKYGVQAIDDEFLEWFVKNPNCEEVETFIDTMGCTLENCDANPCINYKIIIPKESLTKITNNGDGTETLSPSDPNFGKIIIPKEEPKQKCDKCFGTGEDQMNDIAYKKCINCNGKGEEPKQETLEEAASILAIKSVKEYMKIFPNCNNTFDYRKGFEEGFIQHFKWQQERSYSEEEVVQIVLDLRFKLDCNSTREEVTKWFEQFKKK